ncbi:hypothetical protein Bbelb_365220 [Branchiostoma belcheri]|nr:hypothetical protein Bbelb_365220 [Branchiostoma belcheri]
MMAGSAALIYTGSQTRRDPVRDAPGSSQDPARDLTAVRPNCKSRSAPYRKPHGSRRETDRAPDGSLTEAGSQGDQNRPASTPRTCRTGAVSNASTSYRRPILYTTSEHFCVQDLVRTVPALRSGQHGPSSGPHGPSFALRAARSQLRAARSQLQAARSQIPSLVPKTTLRGAA